MAALGPEFAAGVGAGVLGTLAAACGLFWLLCRAGRPRRAGRGRRG